MPVEMIWARWLLVWALLALCVAPAASVAGAQPRTFEDAVIAGAGTEAGDVSTSPYGDLSIPAGAEQTVVTLTWAADTDPGLHLTLELSDGRADELGEGPGPPLASGTGPSPLTLRLDVSTLDRLGWRVSTEEGVAADQAFQGTVSFLQPEGNAEDQIQPAGGEVIAGPADEGVGTSAVTASAVVLAGVLLLARYWSRVQLFLIGLFSRIGDDEVADHPRRRRILDLLDEHPGMHFKALARALDIGHGTLEHHLAKLEDAGMVTVHATQGYRCYFRTAQLTRDEQRALTRLRSPTARQILALVERDPDTSQRAIAQAVGVTVSTVHYHLDRLVEAGLVAPTDQGRGLTGLGERVIDLVQPG